MNGLLRTTLIITFIHCIEPQNHEYGLVETCGDTLNLDQFLVMFDDLLMAHVDYDRKKDVLTIPDFVTPVQYPSLYWDALRALSICREAGEVLKEVYANSSEILEPPWSSIYSKRYPELNVKNTLICHVTGFFPPPVTISWTKNNMNVTNSSSFSQYYPNKDGSMNIFSRLSFIPVEGDVYSCSVEHKSLQHPQTRIWEVEIEESDGLGRVVFCGVGLSLGLLGLAAGVFFIVKGSNCT